MGVQGLHCSYFGRETGIKFASCGRSPEKDFGGRVVERAFQAQVLETSQKIDEMTSLHCGASAPVLVLGFELPCRILALLSSCKAGS